MKIVFYCVFACGVGLTCLWPQLLWSTLLVSVLLAAILLAVSGTITAHIMLSMNHTVRPVSTSEKFSAFHKYIVESFNAHVHKPHSRLPVVFGRSVDYVLHDLLDLVVRDLISPWLQHLSFSSKSLQDSIKEEIWLALGKLHDRLGAIDETKLLAVDMMSKVTSHFEHIRVAQSSAIDDGLGQFYLSHHLSSPEKELSYLRKVSELILVVLFSRSSVSHSLNKNFLIEILACNVLQPSIAMITDPDYINLKILDYMEQVQQAQHLHMHTYAHAESYQEFIHLIKNNVNIDHLKHIRYSIMTEIMQATTIQNLKKAKELVKEKDPSSNRRLRRYLEQLSYAKTQCEIRLRALGCPGFPLEQDCIAATERNILPLEKILENVWGRKRLSQFLESGGQESLLAYWAAVEELKNTDKKNWHQIGAEIYYTFIHSPAAQIKVEKSVRRRMEYFLLGNTGPEVFYEVQDQVLGVLREKVHPTFVTTDLYQQFLQESDSNTQDSVDDSQLYLEDDKEESVLEQTGYARTKLNQLQEKLNNKSQALQALRTSLKPESKVLSGLEKEVENLEGEKRQLEAHLNRTEAWGEHLGKWRAVVQSAEATDEKEAPQFVLVVHVLEDDQDSDAISTGWVVLRKLSEFHELHRKLSQLWSGVKQLELPSQSPKFIFGKQSDKNSLEKAKSQIHKYLEFVLKDERLNASEALYTFLSPSSEHLKLGPSCIASTKKNNRFSFSTFFKSSSQPTNSEVIRDSDDDEMSLLDEGDGRLGAGVEGKDAIAEPLYALLGEVFEMRGLFRWLRKTLITFVQITYGRTISRQVVETVAWLFSEQMVHYYLQVFTQAWWPNGVLARPSASRTNEEKLKTRTDAKEQFTNNTPDVLNNLVGQQNARRGAVKVFEVLQDVRLNKQLFYDLFELLIYEVFPELKRKRAHMSPGKVSKPGTKS